MENKRKYSHDDFHEAIKHVSDGIYKLGLLGYEAESNALIDLVNIIRHNTNEHFVSKDETDFDIFNEYTSHLQNLHSYLVEHSIWPIRDQKQ